MKLAAVIASIVLALAGRAFAQPGMMEPAPVPAAAPSPEPRPARTGERLSEEMALALSVAGTVGSWGLLLGAGYIAQDSEEAAELLATTGALGVMFGPGFGHWYAGKFATRGLGLRAAGLASAVLGVGVALAECPLFSEEECDPSVGTTLLIVGAGLFIGGTIDDIVTAPSRARRRNQRFESVGIAPVLTSRSAGFALGGRF